MKYLSLKKSRLFTFYIFHFYFRFSSSSIFPFLTLKRSSFYFFVFHFTFCSFFNMRWHLGVHQAEWQSHVWMRRHLHGVQTKTLTHTFANTPTNSFANTPPIIIRAARGSHCWFARQVFVYNSS
jgi:hypothetical protein